MVRYSLLILAVLGSAATAIAAIVPVTGEFQYGARNTTVIEKNQAFPQSGPLTAERCTVADCSGDAG